MVKKACELGMLMMYRVLVMIVNEEGRAHTFAVQKPMLIVTEYVKVDNCGQASSANMVTGEVQVIKALLRHCPNNAFFRTMRLPGK